MISIPLDLLRSHKKWQQLRNATCTDNTNYDRMLCWKQKQVFTFVYLFIYFLAKGPKQTLHVSRYMDAPLKMNSNNLS